MKTHRTLKPIRGLAVVAGGFALFTGALEAAPLIYNPGDLVLAVRQTGNAFDYVVNIGKATNYNTLPRGTSLAISNLSNSELTSAFPSVNELKWSVAAANRPPVDANYPIQTLWITAPRLDPNVQSASWQRKSQYTQATAGAQIDAIGNNAAAYSSSQPASPSNTVAGVVIPTSSDYALKNVIGDSGNYVGSFQGNVENETDPSFDSDPSNVSRSDLYELLPGSGDGRYLGYFELKPDGSLVFRASASPPPRPVITSIVRSGNVSTISFTTVAGATVPPALDERGGIGLPRFDLAIGASITGTSAVLSLLETNASGARFFTVDAQ